MRAILLSQLLVDAKSLGTIGCLSDMHITDIFAESNRPESVQNIQMNPDRTSF